MKIDKILRNENVELLSYQTILINSRPYTGDKVYNFVSKVKYFEGLVLSKEEIEEIKEFVREIKSL